MGLSTPSTGKAATLPSLRRAGAPASPLGAALRLLYCRWGSAAIIGVQTHLAARIRLLFRPAIKGVSHGDGFMGRGRSMSRLSFASTRSIPLPDADLLLLVISEPYRIGRKIDRGAGTFCLTI